MLTRPANMAGVIAASVPPQMTTSASPARISRRASSSAYAPLAQASALALTGPCAPTSMATSQAGMLVREEGTKCERARSALGGQQPAYGGLDGVEAGDGGVDDHADPGGVAGVDGEPGVGDRLAGGDHRELAEPGHPSQLFAGEVFGRREAPHLGGDPGGQRGGIEGGDRADARLAGQQALPGAVAVETERRDGTDASDDDVVGLDHLAVAPQHPAMAPLSRH